MKKRAAPKAQAALNSAASAPAPDERAEGAHSTSPSRLASEPSGGGQTGASAGAQRTGTLQPALKLMQHVLALDGSTFCHCCSSQGSIYCHLGLAMLNSCSQGPTLRGWLFRCFMLMMLLLPAATPKRPSPCVMSGAGCIPTNYRFSDAFQQVLHCSRVVIAGFCCRPDAFGSLRVSGCRGPASLNDAPVFCRIERPRQ